jgi:hypothetical protein
MRRNFHGLYYFAYYDRSAEAGDTQLEEDEENFKRRT